MHSYLCLASDDTTSDGLDVVLFAVADVVVVTAGCDGALINVTVVAATVVVRVSSS